MPSRSLCPAFRDFGMLRPHSDILRRQAARHGLFSGDKTPIPRQQSARPGPRNDGGFRSAGNAYCFSAAATSESGEPTLGRHWNTSTIAKIRIGLMKRKTSISYDEAIFRRLRKDADFAAEYLKAALEDEDEPRVLLIALRHLAQAQGIAKVAKAAGIERESLYRALSAHGNPRLSTLVAVTKAIGLRLTVEVAQ